MTAALKQALEQYLAGHPLLRPLIAGRVRPRWIRPGDTRPCLTYTLVSCTRPRTLDSVPQLARARVQVVSWGGGQMPYQSASDLADAARTALVGSATTPGFAGSVPYVDTATGQAMTLTVQRTNAEDEQDLDQPVPTELAQANVAEAVTQDFFIWYQE